MRLGRARLIVAIVVTASGLSVAVHEAGAGAAASARATATILQFPAGADSGEPRVVSDGFVAGYAGWHLAPGSAPTYRSVLWSSSGVPTVVDTQLHGGIVAGMRGPQWETGNLLDQNQAFTYKHGTYTPLPSSLSAAYDMNQHGEVVGWLTDTKDQEEAAAYDPATGSVKALPSTNPGSWAQAINDAGNIVGTNPEPGVLTPTLGNQPAAWIRGQFFALGTLGGNCGQAMAINSSDTVVGYTDSQSHVSCYALMRPFVWSPGGTLQPLPVLPGTVNSQALGINDAGTIVGSSTDSAGGSYGWVFRNGQLETLDSLVTGWSVTAAEGIDNSNEVLAYGYRNGVGHSLLINLTPGATFPTTTTTAPTSTSSTSSTTSTTTMPPTPTTLPPTTTGGSSACAPSKDQSADTARTVVATVPLKGCAGYWIATANGQVKSFGSARFHGDLQGRHLNAPIVGMARTPDGAGYWILGADGGIFSFGNAVFYGSTGGRRLNAPVVAIAATPNGHGYWLAASDGGIFTFGNATFHGSTGSLRLKRPVVGIAPTPAGNGYWLVASDGGIFAFNARFSGSMGGTDLNQPVVGMTSDPAGRGYRLFAADGGIFSFGAPYFGSLGGTRLTSPVVSVATSPRGNGYYILQSDGTIHAYGDVTNLGNLDRGLTSAR